MNIFFEIIKFVFGFIIGIPFYILIGIGCVFIYFRDKNKPYIRARKPYRVWQNKQLQKLNYE